MQRIQEAVYDTPDPCLRSIPSSPFIDLQDREDGVTTLRKIGDRRLSMPLVQTYGLEMHEVAEGRTVVSMPASEWFCGLGANLSCQAIAALTDLSVWSCAVSLQRPGLSVVVLDSDTRFLRFVRPDGRRLRSEATATEIAPDVLILRGEVRDANDRIVALASGAIGRIDSARRVRRQRKETRRMLATMLFTDIVDSTGHAQRLGDTAWRALLEQYKLGMRREVSRCNGTEVDCTGDGFFARFDSPAHAVEAARSLRQAMTALDVEIRAGIHTGECEIEGTSLTGMAVHIASRIQSSALPGEILVSSTVKDLAVGSTLRFVDRGERQLKGVPDPWRVYALDQ
jgi:class 3 adenylate cyclase